MMMDTHKFHHMSMHSVFQKYLLITFQYVPTVLGPTGVEVSKADKVPGLVEQIFQ